MIGILARGENERVSQSKRTVDSKVRGRPHTTCRSWLLAIVGSCGWSRPLTISLRDWCGWPHRCRRAPSGGRCACSLCMWAAAACRLRAPHRRTTTITGNQDAPMPHSPGRCDGSFTRTRSCASLLSQPSFCSHFSACTIKSKPYLRPSCPRSYEQRGFSSRLSYECYCYC